jgi:hypothetical protein
MEENRLSGLLFFSPAPRFPSGHSGVALEPRQISPLSSPGRLQQNVDESTPTTVFRKTKEGGLK